MDINRTYFHLLTGERDWEERDGELLHKQHLWWDRERGFLGLTPKILQFPQQPDHRVLTPGDRRGAACDGYGNIFWIGEDEQEIRFLPAGTRTAGVYWSANEENNALTGACLSENVFKAAEKAGPMIITRLRGLTVAAHQYLVAGTLLPAGLLIFDLHAGGPPTWVRWPLNQPSPPQPFAPFDMAPAPEQGIWILDGNPEDATPRLWHLDRFFRIIAPKAATGPQDEVPKHDFIPAAPLPSGHPAGTAPGSVSFEHGFSLTAQNAVAIEGLPDGTILVLDSPSDAAYSTIHRFRHDELLGTIALTGGDLEVMLASGRLKAHDFAFVPDAAAEPDRVSGQLTLVADHGNQAFVFDLVCDQNQCRLDLRPRYLPLRRFGGKALVSVNDTIFYDLLERWFPLTPQPRQRFETQGCIEGIVLDGKIPDCVWHRMMIDGCIAEGTGISIETRAANEKDLLAAEAWFQEPGLHLRSDGSEIPMHQPFTDRELQHGRMGTWESLLQNAKGRYLELRLCLSGSGPVTPRIRALRVYYPRFSYLEKYLPAVYGEQPDSAHLLDRFLAITESFYSALEGRIAKSEALLDVRTAPAEFLEWIAGWVGAIFDPEWDDYRRRLFLSHALLLYRWRGTQIGLRAAIRLAIEPCPDERVFDELRNQREYRLGTRGGNSIRIVENFLTRKFPGVVLGDPSTLQGPDLLPADDIFTSAKGDATQDQRYRQFLQRTYPGATAKAVLDRINSAWQEQYDTFGQIQFPVQKPAQASQARDWVRFVRYEMAVGQPWKPELGAYALHLRFQEYLYRSYASRYGQSEALGALNQHWGKHFESFEEILFSPVLPAVSTIADDWLRFTQHALGFRYAAVDTQHEGMYKEFIASRYRRPEELNLAYGRIGGQTYASFNDVALPGEDAMPGNGPPLFDWIQFVSLALPLKINAHRFTVLVPTEPGEGLNIRGKRLARVEQIVKREKPAHTDFDIKLYWALFQIGGARLGLDTVLGEGSRYAGLVLGDNYLGQSFLAESHPWDITDRTVIGRDPLKEV